MVEFEVFGPFKIDHEISRRGRGGRPKKIVTRQIGRDFWDDLKRSTHAHLASHKGCYVFALRAGRGSMPWYIGKAAKQTLKQEVFTDEKLAKYKKILTRSQRRSPEMYLIVRTKQKGRLGNAIDDLETLLIWIADHRNGRLINKRKVNTQPGRLLNIVNRIGIKGVLNCGVGAPTKAAKAFEVLIHFRERS